uniref:FAD dependent oxidoreductase domain-containing protein n=1 Tax=Attheya septentrionalis TaxID=420275 RepID=A0A7S2XNI1_9STRA|mmetsp:Transcript_22136/g.39894  ORF Transcript_22136/g.39894 Transcript_22136/m.39894 type:complete len:200 (+) Transcript_22136:763-1362(+)
MDVAPNADAKLFQPSQMPAWFRVPPPPPHQSETESTATAIVLTPPIYGLPADPSSDHPSWIKVALHGRDTVVDPDANLTQTCVTPEELDELARPTIDFLKVATRRTTQIKTTMNDNNSQSPPLFVLAKPCLYTVTPDEHFLVGPPAAAASQRNVYAAARLSGHGFKMVPALGQALADLALENGTTNLPIEFLSPTRFHI